MKKYNYLFIIPRYAEKQLGQYTFPLGICYVSAAMKVAKGSNVYSLNLNHVSGSIEEILKSYIDKYSIDVVLSSGLCLEYANINDLTKNIKRINKNIITIVGGGIITGDPETAMKALEFVDYGIIGEGEESVVALCDCLEKNDELYDINGIIFRKDSGNVINTGFSSDIVNLNNIPWPDYEGFSFGEYLNNSNLSNIMAKKKNTLVMITSRSCPFNCTFCFHACGKTYRQRSLDDVFAELEYLLFKYDFEYIFFVDELFGSSMKRLQEFCQRIKKITLKGWFSYFRVDQITDEKVLLLKDAGCRSMCFGLESADNSVLDSMNKKITIEDIESVLTILKRNKMGFLGNFIFGDPEETYETSINTLNWWYKHPEYQDFIKLSPLACYPGTPIYWSAVKRGIIKDRVKFLRDGCPIVNISKMSDEEYSSIMKKIDEASLGMVKDLENIINTHIDYETYKYSFRGICHKCNKENIWNDKNMFLDAFLDCEECGAKYNIPIIKELVIKAMTRLDQVTSQNSRVGVWGIGLSVGKFLMEIGVENRNNVFLFDRQLTSLGCKKVNKPEKLLEKDIDILIIPSVRYFKDISSIAKDEYGIKNIIGIYDLLK